MNLENLLSNKNYQDLFKKYSEKHRYYHTWDHVLSMLHQARELDITLTSSQYVAILYHDAIYEIGSTDNEHQSALYMLDECDSGTEKAANIIRATKKHHIDQDVDDETAIVLDLDICELASPKYFTNMNMVKMEYCTKHSEEEWKIGRKKFLMSMLNRSKIFYTTHFNKSVAITNMLHELDTL